MPKFKTIAALAASVVTAGTFAALTTSSTANAATAGAVTTMANGFVTGHDGGWNGRNRHKNKIKVWIHNNNQQRQNQAEKQEQDQDQDQDQLKAHEEHADHHEHDGKEKYVGGLAPVAPAPVVEPVVGP